MIRILFILSSFITTCFCFSSNDFELFHQANEQYREHNFEEALIVYNQMHDKDGAVWCNMAHAAYEVQDYIQALVFWNRAKSCGLVFDDMVNKKIEVVHQKLGLYPFHDTRWLRWIEMCPVGIIQCLFLLICILSVGWFTHNSVEKYQTIVLTCSLLVAGGAVWYKYTNRNRQVAVVTQVGTSFRAGPGKQYHEILLLDKVAYLYRVGTHADWSKVVYNGNTAWLPTQSIEII